MITTSEKIDALAAALAKAQGQMGAAVKDSANPFFKSKYADLASVWDACRKPLADNELCVIQAPHSQGCTVSVETMLAHSSGQWLRETLTATAKDESPQAVGSIVTYLRRYGLQSIVGVAPEDDDAEAAQGRRPEPQHARANGNGNHHRKPEPPPAPADPLTNDQRATLMDVAGSVGLIKGNNASGLLELCSRVLGRHITSSKDLGASDYPKVMGAVEERIKALEAQKDRDVAEVFG